MATQALDLVVKRVARFDNGGSTLRAFCDVAVNDAILLKGLKVVEGKNGLFVSMPREQGKSGQWYDTIAPLTKEARQELSKVVLEAYHAHEPVLE